MSDKPVAERLQVKGRSPAGATAAGCTDPGESRL